MRWKLWCFIGILFIVVGCNPKPTIDVVEEGKVEQFIEIENSDQMFEGEFVFADSILLESIEKILKYYGLPFQKTDLLQIRKSPLNNEYSITDVLQISQDKGVQFLPHVIDYNRLEQEIEDNKPIYAEFTFMGNLESHVIFIGYSEEQFAYMDFQTGEKRTIEKSRLATVDQFKVLTPLKDKVLTVAELESSPFYLVLAAGDAYLFDEKENLLKYLTLFNRVELEEWRPGLYDFLFMYYYTFLDFQPDLVQPILENDPQFSRNPAVMEITIKLADYNNEEDKLKSYFGQLQVLPTFQNETLEFIIQKGKYFGYEELVNEAEDMLNGRKE